MIRMKRLNCYQKGIMIAMIVMALIFAAIYPATISRVGYRYKDAILVPHQEDGNTVYSGKMNGEPTQFIVSEGKSIVLQHGNKTYGPYTMKEDPSAIPKDAESAEQMVGVEIYNNKVLFRGGILDFGDDPWLFKEDGTLDNFRITYTTDDGTERDENGNVIDKMEPSASTIYELLHGPELTHKGEALAWFAAVFIGILNALSMLFADELFRWNLSFRIRNAENAEPSDWAMAGRYVGWTVMAIMTLVVFITGLQ